MARERERRMVLEAAGLLIVQRSEGDMSGPPPPPPKRRVLVRARSRNEAKGRLSGRRGSIGSASVRGELATGTGTRGAALEVTPESHVSEFGVRGSGEVHDGSESATVATKRRPAPAAPVRRRPKRASSSNKDLPPIPNDDDGTAPTPIDHAAQLDDAYARYESFRNTHLEQQQQQQQAANNRLSVISTDSTMTSYSSPTSSFTLVSGGGSTQSRVDLSSSPTSPRESDGRSHRHSHIFSFLRAKTPEPGDHNGGAAGGSGERPRKLTISAPMALGSHLNLAGNASQASITGHPALEMTYGSPLTTTMSNASLLSPPLSTSSTVGGGLRVSGGEVSSPSTREPSPAFGTSWASLVDKAALEGFPVNERKRQEAIFELINTEVAYVRDLQLIVEVFYSYLLDVLSQKEITVVFANIEDILLTNTAFLSSLEERQKDCRLYIDRIGDIILNHLPNMGVYMEYCVNQNTANKVLQSLKQNKPELVEHLNKMKENPAVRNLDLASYLLEPMQRITRYPLLIKQIAQYTSASESVDTVEQKDMSKALELSEKLLGSINETIRDQEGKEILQKLSAGGLWIGQGRLDLTAPTRYMGPRKLIKQGVVLKAKSGRKLRAYLCSDILVLTDENGKSLYRMPIPLAHAQVKVLSTTPREGEHAFQVYQPYPRGGDAISLKALTAKEYKQWVHDLESAIRKCRHAEERAVRRGMR
ncbi:Dbl homology domain-containing protein [Ephemerocybe angulata]|uniref:Dbl homology domain-containing protein n=1 Tax=Ephemerocybe angulata TaxID=980116 RepID=A0A8H6I3J0_9AGAR|nr:Dbl homology domain-containing protein [Tulosesus angulatus]